MKDIFITYSINKIKNQCSYNDEKIEEIKYGLEGIYILVTKSIVIFGISIILHIFNELLILLLFFNMLRLVGFGLHAKSSLNCLFSSTVIFIGLTLISKYIVLSLPVRLVISILCVINLALFAPADTEKRPLVNKKRRYIYKFLTTVTALIYTVLQILITNNSLINSMLIALIIESFLVNPLSYKLLGLKYDNYKRYVGVLDKKEE